MRQTIKRSALYITVLCMIIVVSACGAKNNKESVQEHAYPQSKQPIEEAGQGSIPNAEAKTTMIRVTQKRKRARCRHSLTMRQCQRRSTLS